MHRYYADGSNGLGLRMIHWREECVLGHVTMGYPSKILPIESETLPIYYLMSSISLIQ